MYSVLLNDYCCSQIATAPDEIFEMVLYLCTRLDYNTTASWSRVQKLARKGSKGGTVTKHSLIALFGMPYDDMNNVLTIVLSEAWMQYLTDQVGATPQDVSNYIKARKKKVQKTTEGDKSVQQTPAELEALKPITADFYLRKLDALITLYKKRVSYRTWIAAVLAYYMVDPDKFVHPSWMNDGFPGEVTTDGTAVPVMSKELAAIIETFKPASSAAQEAAVLLNRFGAGESMITKAVRFIVQPQTEKGKPRYSFINPAEGSDEGKMIFTTARLWPFVRIADRRMQVTAQASNSTVDESSFYVPEDIGEAQPVLELKRVLHAQHVRAENNAVTAAFAKVTEVKCGFVVTTDPIFRPDGSILDGVVGNQDDTPIPRPGQVLHGIRKSNPNPKPEDVEFLLALEQAQYDVLRLVAGYLPDEGPYSHTDAWARFRRTLKLAPLALACAFKELSPGKGSWDVNTVPFYKEVEADVLMDLQQTLPPDACATLLGGMVKVLDAILATMPLAYQPEWDLANPVVRLVYETYEKLLLAFDARARAS